jgi:23S rRNA (guanine745-N1)-methyltransferase
MIVQQRLGDPDDLGICRCHRDEDIPVLTADMIAALRCPVCEEPLNLTGALLAARRFSASNALRCRNGHSFDLAKQGYIHLGSGRKLPEGDTAAMVEAREEIQSAGIFAPLQAALARNVPTLAHLIADLGAGSGHYLAKILEQRPQAEGIAFDVSKPALRRAARAHPRLGAVLADTWGGLPLAGASVDVLLNVFAPRHGAEMRRVLKPGGVLIVATPAPDHLAELREAAELLSVDESKADRLKRTLAGLSPIGEEIVRWRLDLSAEQAKAMILMGPNAFHAHRDPGAIATTAAVTVTTWTNPPLPSRPAGRDAGR